LVADVKEESVSGDSDVEDNESEETESEATPIGLDDSGTADD
jgi:hypothetical protein